jgi:hypothetical protein
MQKLKLKALEISATGLLTRAELRNVMGKGSVGSQCSVSNQVAECGVDLICLNGHCAPIPDNCTYNGCPFGLYCLGGKCVS